MIVRVFEETTEIELAGTAKELDLLSKQLLVDRNIIALEYKDLNPSPYSKNLKFIQVEHLPNQNVKISIEGNSLLISGSAEKLKILSKNIEIEENEIKNYHIHVEYFDGHFYLSKESKPLVISFQ